MYLTSLERIAMGHSLAGRQDDDILIEIHGPQIGRNHFPALGAGAPEVRIQLFGADPATTVILEECTTLEMVGTNNSNAIGSAPVRGGKLEFSRDPGDWAAVGAAVAVADGLVVRTPGVTTELRGLRIRIESVPASPDPLVGSVEMATDWN